VPHGAGSADAADQRDGRNGRGGCDGRGGRDGHGRGSCDLRQSAPAARERFAAEAGAGAESVELMELTMQNLRDGGTVDRSDFLARADMLCAAGKTVLVSDYFEFHRLASRSRNS